MSLDVLMGFGDAGSAVVTLSCLAMNCLTIEGCLENDETGACLRAKPDILDKAVEIFNVVLTGQLYFPSPEYWSKTGPMSFSCENAVISRLAERAYLKTGFGKTAGFIEQSKVWLAMLCSLRDQGPASFSKGHFRQFREFLDSLRQVVSFKSQEARFVLSHVD